MRVIVVGAGSAGATFAGRLAGDGRHEVVLVEAGPDHGAFADMQWPFEMLDSRRIPVTTHDWGLVNQDPGTDRTYPLARARIMGGCSAHNGCAAVRGVRRDFERWCEAGGSRLWDPDQVLEDFAAVHRGLNVRTYDAHEISPFQMDFYHAARQAGVPHSADINDIDEGEGVTLCPVNKKGGVRWNAAFGFIDPVRGRGNLTIVDNCEVQALILDGSRVKGVQGTREGAPVELLGDRVVLCCGAYHSPMLLMRSGIGDPALLGEAGIELRHALPGVGHNLHDHPLMLLEYEGTPSLLARTERFERHALNHDECTIAKVRSPYARDAFDMHIFSVGGRLPDLVGWYWLIAVGLLDPRSRGRIRPWRKDGALAFAIEHRHVSDRDGVDRAALAWGVAEARRIAGLEPLASSIRETKPGPGVQGSGVEAWIEREHLHYYHPAGSCAIGTDPANGAVVDAAGRVHGLDGLMIADASIMPFVTTANTNLPAAMIGHRLARLFDEIATVSGA